MIADLFSPAFVLQEYERVEAERRMLSMAVEQAAESIVITDPEGRIIYANPAFEKTTGYAARDVIGKNPRIMKSGKQTSEFYKSLWDNLLSGRPWQGRFINKRKDGTLWEEETVISPVRNDQGKVIHYVAVKRDVTKERQAEAEKRELNSKIAEQEQHLKNLVATIPGVVWEAWGEPDSPAQTINFVSDHVQTMLGYSTAQWTSTPNFWLSIVHPDDKKRAAAEAASFFASGQNGKHEFRWVAQDGHIVWVEAHVSVVRNDKGDPLGMRGVNIDITERKELEQQLRQSQKLEGIGQLAGGIAHDFNNLLTVINGYSDMAVEELPPDHALRHKIEEIKKAGLRATALTRQLLAFSRKQVLQPKVIDVNVIVGEAEKMLRRLLGERIDLRTCLQPGAGTVKVDPSQMDQVILNLVINARDAMPEGGRLVITTGDVDFMGNGYGRPSMNLPPGRYVLLAVSDTGVGMDSNTQAHIFEPFFTTKEVGKGTGLGLSTAHGIVRQSGGAIHFETEVGRGTTFKIYLPRIGDAFTHSYSESEPGKSTRGSETILLVEDDPAVRTLARAVLDAYGYNVLEAADAKAALSIAEQYRGGIHLIVTDVVMSGMEGPQLAKELIQRDPHRRVLYMSGYTDNPALQKEIVERAHFIQKPFQPSALVEKVREILDQRM